MAGRSAKSVLRADTRLSSELLARVQLETVGEIVALDSSARQLLLREIAIPWRELRFRIRYARVMRAAEPGSFVDLEPGARVRVRYTHQAAAYQAHHIELIAPARA